MPPRLFLDANVLFTAAISPNGVSRALLELARVGACAALSSPFVVEEARRNIRVKYPVHDEALSRLLSGVELVGKPSSTLVEWASEFLPPKDSPVLAAASSAKVDILVTGDRRHFGHLYGRAVGGVVVLTPRMTLEHVLEIETT